MTIMSGETLELPFAAEPPVRRKSPARKSLPEDLAAFHEFGAATRQITIPYPHADTTAEAPAYVNEFWTAGNRRAASSLHEISYRACFKPQLPRFFIERLTQSGDIVYDPFMGRGTTPLEAALLGRVPYGCDINPLSQVLVRPRLHLPTLDELAQRLKEIDFNAAAEFPEDLLVFYHPETLKEIAALKRHFLTHQTKGALDPVDD